MHIDFERRCWAEVDLAVLGNNFSLIRKAAGSARVMAVVKANAYGHDDIVAARILGAAGADWFAVSGLMEALRLRRAEIVQPILVLGYTSPLHAALLAGDNIQQAVFSLEYAQSLSQAAVQAGLQVHAHFKLDTGMGRLGFNAKDNTENAVAELSAACALPGLVPEALFTHFSVADSTLPEDVAYTRAQFDLFCRVREALADGGHCFPLAHCCNSAATIAYPEMHLDMVRPGIILYGCNPSADVCLPGLQPAFQLKTVVTMVKEIRRGDSISYGRIFTAPRDMRVATLAAGYADGYPRLMSGCGVVALHGKPAPLLGRVCMDQIIVDASDIPEACQGDTATLFGTAPADSIDTIAAACGTVNYEILCNIGRRVQRMYTENGEEMSLFDYTDLSRDELKRYRAMYG